jgi:ribosome silencing factor RsfS/YbeB/iojap
MQVENDILSLVRQTLEDGNGEGIVVLPASRQSGGLFDWLVVVTASSSRHASALAERLRRALKNAGVKRQHKEDSSDHSWLLVDAGSVVAHVMLAEARAVYDLENLWGFEETAS